MERALWLRFDTDAVVHSSVDPLLAAEIAFSCLHGNVTEKELNLFQLSTRSMAQLRARTPQIMRRNMGQPEFSCVMFYNVPDDSFRYTFAPGLARATYTSKQSASRNPGFSCPQVDGGFDPFGHRHGSNVAAFANQINYGPVFFALLQVREFQIGQFAAAESTAQQYGEDRTIPRSFECVRRRRLPEATCFVSREPVSKPHAELFAPFTRRIPAASSGLSRPASAAS
jgi:hypothetical protein